MMGGVEHSVPLLYSLNPCSKKIQVTGLSNFFFFKKGRGANVLIINIIEAVGDS